MVPSVAQNAAACIAPLARPNGSGSGLRLGHPSGLIPVDARAVQDAGGRWDIAQVSVSRSARRLMTGQIWVPDER